MQSKRATKKDTQLHQQDKHKHKTGEQEQGNNITKRRNYKAVNKVPNLYKDGHKDGHKGGHKPAYLVRITIDGIEYKRAIHTITPSDTPAKCV